MGLNSVSRFKHLPFVKYYCFNLSTYEVIVYTRTKDGKYSYLEVLQ